MWQDMIKIKKLKTILVDYRMFLVKDMRETPESDLAHTPKAKVTGKQSMLPQDNIATTGV